PSPFPRHSAWRISPGALPPTRTRPSRPLLLHVPNPRARSSRRGRLPVTLTQHRGSNNLSLYSPSAHGSPQAKNVQIPPRQAALDAQAFHSRARRVPAVPPAEAASPCLPDLRHLQGP